MSCARLLLILTAVLCISCIGAAPFFDAIYDAISGNGRRSYGYSGYGNYGYDNGYGKSYRREEAPRTGKSYKEICRAHFPDSIAFPGAGGVVCPY